MNFTCQCCGNCCRWPGTVSATDDELNRIAKLLGISLDQFIQDYMQLSPDRSKLIFKDNDDGACIFLNHEGRCNIYPERPQQCRTFPYDWDVPPQFQELCTGRKKQLDDAKQPIAFIHVLGHPAKPLDVAGAPADAQVLNCRNFCLMLEHLKIPYAYYGCPDSKLAGSCGTFIDCGKPTGTWKYGNKWHKTYNDRLSKRLKKHARLDGSPELVCSLYGAAQADIDALGLPVIEPMVGYDHCWAPYRVFPSYAQQHTIYALQPDNTQKTRFFDTVIPHFLPADEFHTSQHPGNYLLFLGRDAYGKGLAVARKVAKCANLPLRVVHDGLYGEAKANLIANARAVLMPTLYVEPFGYVAIEAQLCGTPIVTTDWGAFAETVQHGVTGFRCRTLGEFIKAVQAAPTLDRNAIRQAAIQQFSLENVAPHYESYFRFVWNVHTSGGFFAYGATRDSLWT